MAIVVVGGHTRNIGKTSAVAGLIAALPEFHWTAIKITQFGHNVCSADGEPCDCQTTADHPVAISEERDSESGTDTSRFLAAGAKRVLWVRTRQGDLAAALPALRREMGRAKNIILESNSILRFFRPDLYAAVLDPRISDFKSSALRYLDRADALLVPSLDVPLAGWVDVSPILIDRTPRFLIEPPDYVSPAFTSFVREKISHIGK